MRNDGNPHEDRGSGDRTGQIQEAFRMDGAGVN